MPERPHDPDQPAGLPEPPAGEQLLRQVPRASRPPPSQTSPAAGPRRQPGSRPAAPGRGVGQPGPGSNRDDQRGQRHTQQDRQDENILTTADPHVRHPPPQAAPRDRRGRGERRRCRRSSARRRQGTRSRWRPAEGSPRPRTKPTRHTKSWLNSRSPASVTSATTQPAIHNIQENAYAMSRNTTWGLAHIGAREPDALSSSPAMLVTLVPCASGSHAVGTQLCQVRALRTMSTMSTTTPTPINHARPCVSGEPGAAHSR